MTMPRKSTRRIDVTDIPGASAEQLGALRRVSHPPLAPRRESAGRQSLRSEGAEPSDRHRREGIQRDEARAHLRGDVQADFGQLRRGEGRSYDKANGATARRPGEGERAIRPHQEAVDDPPA